MLHGTGSGKYRFDDLIEDVTQKWREKIMSQHLQSCLLRNILGRAEVMSVKEPPVMHKSKKKMI